ncbi:AMP-binding protein [Streptosporangiaceae bacterium NEAU-GS5]|nr:AMP-binding protein [Streptosporangiaceae bacterium NEAU-GS5]
MDAATGTAVSYATLLARMDRVAAGLAARGFQPGDVLALQAPNMAPWADVALGTMAAGGVVTGVSPLATEREITAQLSDSGAAVVPRADAGTGQTPVAFVVAAGPLDPSRLMAWVAERVSPHKRLTAVYLVDAIPRTPSGKILRRHLTETGRLNPDKED